MVQHASTVPNLLFGTKCKIVGIIIVLRARLPKKTFEQSMFVICIMRHQIWKQQKVDEEYHKTDGVVLLNSLNA